MADFQKTPNAQYIFFDVVGFSSERSVEAQTHIVSELNRIVKQGLQKFRIPTKKRILIPTGDGMCVTFLNILEPFDVALTFALYLFCEIEDHNSITPQPSYKFNLNKDIISLHFQKIVYRYMGRATSGPSYDFVKMRQSWKDYDTYHCYNQNIVFDTELFFMDNCKNYQNCLEGVKTC